MKKTLIVLSIIAILSMVSCVNYSVNVPKPAKIEEVKLSSVTNMQVPCLVASADSVSWYYAGLNNGRIVLVTRALAFYYVPIQTGIQDVYVGNIGAELVFKNIIVNHDDSISYEIGWGN